MSGKLNLPYDKPVRLMFKSGNPKTDKNQSVEGLENIVILHLNLAPSDVSGYELCPMASLGCKKACLHTAGNPIFQAQKDKGRIKVFGGSYWTLDRFKKANNWAKNNNKNEMSILNNNLALAKMINPLWSGCLSSNDDDILSYLDQTKKSHMSWSSQARGYFLDDEITKKIEEKITLDESSWRAPGEHSSGPISCYDSEDNRERKKRAIELAEKKGCSAHNIAASWTINQSFPSFALIGPRTINELDTTLPCLDIELSQEEINWLNLL